MGKKRTDRELMKRAIELSSQGFPAPNPHVGCVISRAGEIVGEGWHESAGGPHAEVVALSEAGVNAQGADVFVTLEPCAHVGRTPPCTEALKSAGVRRVVYAVADPNPRAAGGAEVLERSGVLCESGLLAQEAEYANRRWLCAQRLQRPYIVCKAAITLDGRMSTASGESQWITSPESRRRARRLRAELGAVLVGRGTIEADDPQLTVREPDVQNEPVRYVLDPQGRLTGGERVFYGPGSTNWIVGSDTVRTGQTFVPLKDGRFDCDALLESMWRQGTTGCLVEGGSRTVTTFFAADLVDELHLFIGAIAFGSGPPWLASWTEGSMNEAQGFSLLDVEAIGDDLHASYVRKR